MNFSANPSNRVRSTSDRPFKSTASSDRLYKPQKQNPNRKKGPYRLVTLMADRAEKAVKKVKKVNKEGSDGDSDDNVPIFAINRGKKKVEDSEDDEVSLAVSKAKKKSAESKKVGETGNAMPSQVKKEESGDLKEALEKKNGENKKENSKGRKNQNKKSSSDKVKTVKVKKVYDLPGQKHDLPEERDPLRIFYESLYNQEPDSEMAAFWMMERGLLPEDEAKKVFEKKKQNGLSSPAKPLSASKSPAGNASVKQSLDTSSTKNSKDNSAKSKKRKAGSDSEEDSNDDFVAPLKLNSRKKQKVSN